MLNALSDMARIKGSRPFFYLQSDGGQAAFSYRQVRLASAALARELEKRGLTEGSYLASKLYNGAEQVILIMAAAYGGFTLVLLDPHLDPEELRSRTIEIESTVNQGDMLVIDETNFPRLMLDALGMGLQELAAQPSGGVPVTNDALVCMDYAVKREERFDPERIAIVIFTAGTTGIPKATLLSWENLTAAADAANRALSCDRYTVWQLVLPMSHIDGFQVMARSLQNGTPFIVYSRYEPRWLLNDVLPFRVTHIGVVDRVLQDLLKNDRDRVLSQYRCLLLGGAAPNDKTLRKARRARARIYASYSMTETSGMIALAPVNRSFDGGMKLLPGYEVHIMKPNTLGQGSVHVKGPGVFEGYLNSRGSFTLDGWYVTGDRGSVDRNGYVHLMPGTANLIMVGGEIVNPESIRRELLKAPGVKDAFVFGTSDERWGQRAVAFVEADWTTENLTREHEDAGLDPDLTGLIPATCAQEYARNLHTFLDPRLSEMRHPKHILALEKFPRNPAGKVDHLALRQLYRQRIDIKAVRLYRTSQPLAQQLNTSKGLLSKRDSFYVEVEDWAGRTGIGECVSLGNGWYLPETLDDDFEVVKDALSTIVMNERYLHPSQVCRSFASFPNLARFPMAKAAIEPAIWDLYGKIVGRPLSVLIGGRPIATVGGGAVVPDLPVDETLAAVDAFVERGYTRVKLKVSPETMLEKVSAVREKHPHLTLLLDGNQRFTEEDTLTLRKLDAFNIALIEEPLKPSYQPVYGTNNLLERLSLLQKQIKTPVCLDESVVTAEDMTHAMRLENLRCFSLKIAKFGGIQPTLDFYHWAQERGCMLVMGDLFDTSVSKRMHAAFQTLPGIEIEGDLFDSADRFTHDVAVPPLKLEDGLLTLNAPGYEVGLGCSLNQACLDDIVVSEFNLVGNN